MTTLLTDVLKQLALQPGQTRRVRVEDYQVEIQRIDEEHESWPMKALWLRVPPSSKAIILSVARGAPQLPTPFRVTDSDLAPE
jgi:hypothetical protein